MAKRLAWILLWLLLLGGYSVGLGAARFADAPSYRAIGHALMACMAVTTLALSSRTGFALAGNRVAHLDSGDWDARYEADYRGQTGVHIGPVYAGLAMLAGFFASLLL